MKLQTATLTAIFLLNALLIACGAGPGSGGGGGGRRRFYSGGCADCLYEGGTGWGRGGEPGLDNR